MKTSSPIDHVTNQAEFSLIPAGDFQMGDALEESVDSPVVTVNVSAFEMARHKVTKALWDYVREWAIMNGYTDLAEGCGKGNDHPIHSVSWYSAIKWCNARSEMEGFAPCYTVAMTTFRTGLVQSSLVCDWSGNGYRLPTEAEWEKAARGGLTGKRFPWGDTISHDQANYFVYSKDGINDESYDLGITHGSHPAYCVENKSPFTSPVGAFPPNEYGLFDMAGNLFEWCWDWYCWDYWYRSDGATDPRGHWMGSCDGRVIRAGSWGNVANRCRTSNRDGLSPSKSNWSIGFRLARSLLPS